MHKSLISEANDDKAKNIKVDDIVKTFKLFKPDQAITFLAKQYDMKPSEFFAKKFLKIAAYSIKNGLVKTGDIAKSVKDFTKKNIKDNTDINYDNLEIDPDTVKIKTLFGGKDNKVLVDFINKFSEEMKDAESEAEKQAQQLKNDIKKRGVTVSDEELNKNGQTIAGTIYNKENKDLSGKKLKQKIDNDIKQQEIITNALKKSEEQLNTILSKKVKSTNKSSKKNSKKNTKQLSKKHLSNTANKNKTIKKENLIDNYVVASGIASSSSTVKELNEAKTQAVTSFSNSGAPADEDEFLGTPSSELTGHAKEFTDKIEAAAEIRENIRNSALGDEYENLVKTTNLISNMRFQKLKNAHDAIDDLRAASDNMKEALGLDIDAGPVEIQDLLNSSGNDPETTLIIKQLFISEMQLRRCKAVVGYSGIEELEDLVSSSPISSSANVEEIQQQIPDEAQPKQKKSGLFNGALGWAIVGAKVTGFVLNHGKGVIDAFGNQAVKFKEDRGVVAQMTFLATNGEKSDSKFQDTKFSVRFNVDDLKWHATNLDNRKMKFEEDKVINLALNSEEGKKFKKNTINRWRRLFKGKNKNGKTIFTYIIDHASQFKLDKDKKLLATLSKMNSNFDKIEQQFA